MPLSNPAPRRRLHDRKIGCEGYEREDGLFDIEARIIDTKTYETEDPYRGKRAAGMHVHDMQVRLTLDRGFVVRAIEVTTNDSPYDICPSVAPGYQKLVGARVGAGWRKAVTEAVGRTKGCTHISELLMPVATVAFQTMGNWKAEREKAGTGRREASEKMEKPGFIDGCKAWASDGPVVERLFPMFFRKP